MRPDTRTPQKSRVSVLLLGGKDLFGQGLAALLSADERFHLQGSYQTGMKALSEIRSQRPQLAILEQTMARPGGDEITARVIAERLATRCVILTERTAPFGAQRAFQAGAAACVLKDATFSELASILLRVAAGEDLAEATPAQAEAPEAPERAGLSKRETEVLRLVARGFTTRQIAETLFISPRTVDSHRFQIMQKLEIANGPGLVKYAHEHGVL